MIIIVIIVDSLMPMFPAVALFTSTFAFAPHAKFPSADTDSHVLASFKVAFKSQITVVNRLSHVHYLDNLRCLCYHPCWHDHLLRRLLLHHDWLAGSHFKVDWGDADLLRLFR